MKSTWLTKTLFKNALKNNRVYMSAALQTRNGITGYNLYIKRKTSKNVNGGMWSVLGHSPYWSDKKQFYHVTAWGTSRPLEIILSIGYELGLKFGDIRQNWTFL